ncbi:MAG: hypothetical protein AAF916_06730 [Planctomycetota bacterium]
MNSLIRAVLVYVCGLLLPGAATADTASPRVAVFDPEQGTVETRFAMDLAYYDAVASVLETRNVSVERLTADAMLERLDSSRFDAVFFDGEAVPHRLIPIIHSFVGGGGVLIGAGAKVPFNVAVETADDGTWTMSPRTPKFAWETGDVLNRFGLAYVYDPKKHDTASRFTATDLLKRYLPEASDPPAPIRNWWIVPNEAGESGGTFYPLIRSQRLDGRDVTPQLSIVRFGDRHMILGLNRFFTDGSEPDRWPHAEALVVALAEIARDLRHGALHLHADMAVEIDPALGPLPPLRRVQPIGAADPEGLTPIARWGSFDGSNLELEAANSDLPSAGNLPAVLEPGASVTFDVPDFAGAARLRARVSFDRSRAGLCVLWDDVVVWNELFVHADASGDGNHTPGAYDEVPGEVTRLIALPERAETITMTNPGEAPLHFDAVQLEPADTKPARWMGQYVPFALYRQPEVTIPDEESQRWSVVRADIKSQWVGPPGDPNRWDRVDALMQKLVAFNPRLNLILLGYPEWAAVSPERYAAGVKAGRPHTVPPDPAKYREIVEWAVQNYGDYIAVWELGNEADIQAFWRGTTEEYIAFAQEMHRTIREHDPDAVTMLAGMAHVNQGYLAKVLDADFAADTDFIGLHPYTGQAAAWDVAYGQLQGILYARGDHTEIYCNEMGFTWRNGEWFTDNWTRKKQADAYRVALGRLLATDIAKLTFFHAGGDDHHFGLYQADGTPSAAADLFNAYLPLAEDGGRRQSVALTSATPDTPLQGVYAAASVHDSGQYRVVLNGVECPTPRQAVRLGLPWTGDRPPTVTAQPTERSTNPIDTKLTVEWDADRGFVWLQADVTTEHVWRIDLN